jgi:uncharacterized protein YaaN involved in tellurite resistance
MTNSVLDDMAREKYGTSFGRLGAWSQAALIDALTAKLKEQDATPNQVASRSIGELAQHIEQLEARIANLEYDNVSLLDRVNELEWSK